MKDIELRGIVPPEYFEDPKAAQRRRTLTHEMAAFHLEDFLPQRPNPQEVEEAGVVPQEYFNNPVKFWFLCFVLFLFYFILFCFHSICLFCFYFGILETISSSQETVS